MTAKLDPQLDEESLPSTDRVEAFTDGVIGVVATLLVLDLRVPSIDPHANSMEALARLGPTMFRLVPFSLCFFFVVIVWVNHHQVFHTLKGADRGILWWNNLLLFSICLLPFPASFLGEYPALRIAPALLSLTLCASSMAFFMLIRHVSVARLYEDGIDEATRASIMRRSLVGPPVFAGAAAVSFFSPIASIVSMFAIMAYYCVPARVVRKQPLEPKPLAARDDLR